MQNASSNPEKLKTKKKAKEQLEQQAAAEVAASEKKASTRTKAKKATEATQDSPTTAAEDQQDAATADECHLVEGALGAQDPASVASDSSPVKQLAPRAVVELKEADRFRTLLTASGEQENKNSKNLVLACFSASWCRPCIVFAPRLELIARRYNQVAFVKLNVDKMPEIADMYSVKAVPTFMLFNSGSKVGAVVSANQAKIEELLNNNGALPTEEVVQPADVDGAVNEKAKLKGSKLKKD